MSVRAGERAALMILETMDTDQAYLGQAFSKVLKSNALTGADRSAAVAFAKLVVENKQAVDFALSHFTKLNKCGRTLRNILRLGTARILFGQGEQAQIVHASVELCKAFGKGAQGKFVNAVLRNLVRQREQIPWPDRKKDLIGFFSTKYSWPKFAVEQAILLLGEEQAERFLSCRLPQPVTIRINPQQFTQSETPEEFFNRLGIKAKKQAADDRAYALENVEDVPAMDAYQQGMFSLQGLASMIAARQAICKEGIILDVCAAPGGKTCYLAEACPQANIYAFDLHPHRVALLQAQAKRLGLNNIKSSQHDATQPLMEFENKADCVLVDAPCTGLGTACHRPDVKWNKKEQDAIELSKVQKKILDNASHTVKIGGKLIYCTCTFTKTENENVVSDFLEHHPEFTLSPVHIPQEMNIKPDSNGMLRLWPHIHHTDGFFICVMERMS